MVSTFREESIRTLYDIYTKNSEPARVAFILTHLIQIMQKAQFKVLRNINNYSRGPNKRTGPIKRTGWKNCLKQ